MRVKLIVGFFIFLLLFVQAPVFAQTATPTAKPKVNRLQNASDKASQRASMGAERRAEKLSQARLNICKGRAISIKNRVNNTVNRGGKMHTRLESLVTAVDNFYNNRLVPQGMVLENHDELLADIEAKKTNVATLLDQAKATGAEFSCDSDDPKGQLEAFKADMKGLVEAFKEYKLSVRTFVMAVKDLAATNSNPSESEVVE